SEDRGEPVYSRRVENPEALQRQRTEGRLARTPVGRHGEQIARLLGEMLDMGVVRAVRVGEPRHTVPELAFELLAGLEELRDRRRIRHRGERRVRHGVRADLYATPLKVAQLLPGEEAGIAARDAARDD